MVKVMKPTKKNRTKAKRKSPPQGARPAAHGPVSTITTAPVAIGNSVRGSSPKVIITADGARVVGRDFAFAASATPAAVTGWTLVGGLPLTPSVMPSSSLKSYCQMYAKYKVNSIAAHYITSSATSQAGDVMFMYERDREGPMLDWTSNSFLPATLSDPHTILGPQWTNHTAVITPTTEFKSTDYGVHSDINADACGVLNLFSKTNAASSPGYVLLDYDISFRELQVNPRAGVLPVTRGQLSPLNLQVSAVAAVAGSTGFTATIAGNDITGAPTALPTGATIGDIYRCIFDVTNSTITNSAWTNATRANLLNYEVPTGTDVAVTVDDGFTCYAVLITSNTVRLYPSLASAYSAASNFTYGVTATVTANINCFVSLVANIGPIQQAAY